MPRVGGGHDPVQHVVVADDRLGGERVHNRRRVGEPGRLDDDAAEVRDLAAGPAAVEVAQLVGEVAAQRAAEAARGEQDGVGWLCEMLNYEVREGPGA